MSRILLSASECVPFAKTGGLADVVGALPRGFAKYRHQVRLILPFYRQVRSTVKDLHDLGETVRIPMGDHEELGRLLAGTLDYTIPVYFVDHPRYFDREFLYRTSEADYPDNAERFIFFCRAVLEGCKAVNFRPDIIHVHDWQTGLVPAYMKTLYRIDAFFNRTASVFTIHNIAYQGMFPKETLFQAGFGWHDFTPERLEYYGQLNCLKAGIVYADRVTTVSPTYARQIQESPAEGRGMEGVLRTRGHDVAGILNGIDNDLWNPATDPHLPAHFTKRDLKGKALCKAALQRRAHLKVGNTPMIGMVSRLDPQKGFDLVAEVVESLMDTGAQLCILGTGDRVYHELLTQVAKTYPGQLSVTLSYDDPMAHVIYAGSDYFLMPSRFEPCGLGQMISMRYGAVPVVHQTGGLADTVTPFRPSTGQGTGFLFQEPTGTALLACLRQALAVYPDRTLWSRLVMNGMSTDVSWNRSIRQYLALYQEAMASLRTP